jgi:hypothetical protein
MSLLVPKRVDEPELLDEHDAPRQDMERSLRDLRRINRYLGGIGVYRRLLRRLGGGDASRLSVLDLGTGTSDLLANTWGNGLKVGLDFKIDHLLYGREMRRINGRENIALVVGDARNLPFRGGVIDIVTSSHFVHHFTADENTAILRESLRIARRGVAVNDTNRHHVPLLCVRLLAALRLVGRITRSDAPGSVLRGYTPDEARAFAAPAGASRVEIVPMWPFRTGLLLWK